MQAQCYRDRTEETMQVSTNESRKKISNRDGERGKGEEAGKCFQIKQSAVLSSVCTIPSSVWKQEYNTD